MSINYDEYVGVSALTWEQVYEAFKARIVEELGDRYELVELHTWESGPDLDICTGCGMHVKSHLDGCPVAAAELDGVLTTETVEVLTRVPLQPTPSDPLHGRLACGVCGKDLVACAPCHCEECGASAPGPHVYGCPEDT